VEFGIGVSLNWTNVIAQANTEACADALAQVFYEALMEPLAKEELQFCELYVNGGLEFAGRPKKCYVEVFGDKAAKNPHSSANYLLNKPHVLAQIKALLSSERFDMETSAIKLQVPETLKAVMDETTTTDYTDRFGVPLSPAPLRAVSVNAAKALMEIFPVKHKEESRLRIEGGAEMSSSTSSYLIVRPKMKKRRIGKKEIAWWVYLIILVARGTARQRKRCSRQSRKHLHY